MSLEQENKYNHLQELNGSDYQIVEGEPDITGWDVIDAEGRKIGDVDDVLFDPQTRAVRYIIVDLDDNELDIDVDKKVLVPIGIAELSDEFEEEEDEDEIADTPYSADTANDTAVEYEADRVDSTIDEEDDDEVEEDDDDEEDEDFVYLPSVTVEHLLALPAYESGNVSPEQEVAIRSIFERSSPSDAVVAYDQDKFYTHHHFANRIYPNNQADNERRTDL